MVKHTRDSTKENHLHLINGDIIYTKDNFSVMGGKVLSQLELASKMASLNI